MGEGTKALRRSSELAFRLCDGVPVLRVRASVRTHWVEVLSGDDVCAEDNASAFESVADGSASVLDSASGPGYFGARVCEWM
jgi:hypothetical protein